MITEEAVKAAAASLVGSMRGDNTGYVDASDLTDMVADIRNLNLPEAARKALEAAGPHVTRAATDVAGQDLPQAAIHAGFIELYARGHVEGVTTSDMRRVLEAAAPYMVPRG